MNDQLQKWQQQYQNSTPQVNSQKLIAQVQTKRKREKFIAWSEMMLGVAISIYCLVAMLVFAQGWQTAVIYGALSPIPFCFSLWSFKSRQKQWKQTNLNIQGLLNFKRQNAIWQEQYWRISAFVVSGLWLLLLVIGLAAYLTYGEVQPWILLLGVNALVVLTTLVKYSMIRRSLPACLKAIEELRG